MEHEDDPDVDEPLATPVGHVLGREPTPAEQGGPEGPEPGAGGGRGGVGLWRAPRRRAGGGHSDGSRLQDPGGPPRKKEASSS